MRKVVVGPDLTLDWLKKRTNIFGEIDEQLIRGLETPGQGLTLDHLQALVEHRNPFPESKIQPPMGGRGRIHIVSIPVDESRPWDEAVWAVGQNTPPNYDVWKLGDQYPPAQGEGTHEVILVNFGKDIESSRVALDWATGEHLRPASPRTALAVGEHCPNLHRDLGWTRWPSSPSSPVPSGARSQWSTPGGSVRSAGQTSTGSTAAGAASSGSPSSAGLSEAERPSVLGT